MLKNQAKDKPRSGLLERLVSGFLRWPSKPGDPKWRYANPWWLIVWKCIWIPMIVVGKIIFAAGVTMAHGPSRGREAWRATE